MPRSRAARAAFGQHDQPVELAARQAVGPLAFLRRRCGVGRNPQQALGAGQSLLLLVGEAGAPSSDRFGFGDVERGDVLLDGIKVVAGGVAVVDEVRDAGGTEEVRPHLGPVEALGARVAHIGHQREVEQLGHVQLVLQPPGVGPVMFLDRAGDRAPRCCVVPGAWRRRKLVRATSPGGCDAPERRITHTDQRHKHEQQLGQPEDESHKPRMPPPLLTAQRSLRKLS